MGLVFWEAHKIPKSGNTCHSFTVIACEILPASCPGVLGLKAVVRVAMAAAAVMSWITSSSVLLRLWIDCWAVGSPLQHKISFQLAKTRYKHPEIV